MKIVQKANKQVRIEDDRMQDFLARGFCEVDEAGKMLKKAEDKDAKKDSAALRKQIEALETKISEVEKENAALKQQLAKPDAE